jgi:hypothetical protein
VIDYFHRRGLQGLAQDYEVSSFLGTLGTGFDVRLSKSVSVTAGFKFYKVLSARENTNLPNYGYGSYGLVPGGYYPYAGVTNGYDADKQYTGGSLARSSFYTITGGVTFSF